VKHHPAAPAPPAPAVQAFPAGVVAALQEYADLLATEAVLRGLIGPREVPRLWERHLLNCATLAELIPRAAKVCDLGSGAGLPGLVLAIVRADLHVTLVEPLSRRTTFLDGAVAALQLDQVEVIRGRAESLHGRRTFDVVTARALAPMTRLIEWAIPLVAGDGELLALKGRSAASELEVAAEALVRFGCSEPAVVVVPQVDGESTTTIIRVSRAASGR
jgi:16S rRNA (guanine527-N7)-methyltransferase